MIARVQKSIQEKDKGFTLIELLVVIIIIGILSAIAIPVFLNQRKKAVDAGIKSDMRSIANEMETYFVDKQTYLAGTVAVGSATSPATVTWGTGATANVVTLSDWATTIAFTTVDADKFIFTGVNTSKGTSTEFTYDSAAGGLSTP